MSQPVAKQQECPVCLAVVPINPGYVTWCDRCGWNLQPLQPERGRGILASLNESLGRKQNQAILTHFLQARAHKPALTLTMLLALVLSAIVHSITLGLFLLGLLALVRGWPYLFTIVAGLLFIAVAWVLRPRFAKIPETLSRSEYPALYQLADTVAASLHAPRVDGIVVDEAFNAAFGQVGWQRKRILYLGLPFWAILNAQERVAILGHELAHSVNRDPSRGFFIGTALHSLASWYDLLHPQQIWDPRRGFLAFAAVPAYLFLWGLSSLVWLAGYLLALLLWRDTQRAEYLADRLGGEISGTAAALSSLEKLHLEEVYLDTVRQVALNRDRSDGFFTELQRGIATVPPREVERIRRVTQMAMTRLDTTHPPTACRVQALEAHRVDDPSVTLSSTDSALIDAELARLKSQVLRKLIERYQASLYFPYR